MPGERSLKAGGGRVFKEEEQSPHEDIARQGLENTEGEGEEEK